MAEGQRERGGTERGGLSEGLLTSADKEGQGISDYRPHGSELLKEVWVMLMGYTTGLCLPSVGKIW